MSTVKVLVAPRSGKLDAVVCTTLYKYKNVKILYINLHIYIFTSVVVYIEKCVSNSLDVSTVKELVAPGSGTVDALVRKSFL